MPGNRRPESLTVRLYYPQQAEVGVSAGVPACSADGHYSQSAFVVDSPGERSGP